MEGDVHIERPSYDAIKFSILWICTKKSQTLSPRLSEACCADKASVGTHIQQFPLTMIRFSPCVILCVCSPQPNARRLIEREGIDVGLTPRAKSRQTAKYINVTKTGGCLRPRAKICEIGTDFKNLEQVQGGNECAKMTKMNETLRSKKQIKGTTIK